MSKEGFVFEPVKCEFDVMKSEDCVKIPSYYMTDNNEYAEVLDIDASNVKHHINVRYNAAIRGQSVKQYADKVLSGLTGLERLETEQFFLEVFDLN